MYSLIIFWFGNIIEWYTAKRVVLDHGIVREANPVMLWLINKLGATWKAEAAYLLIKILLGVGLHLIAAPSWIFTTLGYLFIIMAVANKFRMLNKLIEFLRFLLGKI